MTRLAFLVGAWLVSGCVVGPDAPRGRGGLSLGGCQCPSGPEQAASVSVDCLCAEFPGACPSYDEIKYAAPEAGPEHWRPCFGDGRWYATERTGCGKLVFGTGPGTGGWTYVYDERSLELIGASLFSDVQFGSCSSNVYSAGESAECDEATVCSLCDDSGAACAPACSLELLERQGEVPSYEWSVSLYDCQGWPEDEPMPELRNGCGRVEVVTSQGTVTFAENTRELLAMSWPDAQECGGVVGDAGETCPEMARCSLCAGAADQCQLEPNDSATCACRQRPEFVGADGLACFCSTFPEHCPSFAEATALHDCRTEPGQVVRTNGCGDVTVATSLPDGGTRRLSYSSSSHELTSIELSLTEPAAPCEWQHYAVNVLSPACERPDSVCSLCSDDPDACPG